MTTIEHKKRVACASLAMGGGDGKTWQGQLTRCLFELLGEPLALFDADQGNRALSLSADDVVVINIMDKPEENLAKVREAIDEGVAIILDAGANALADSLVFVNFLLDLALELRRHSYAVKGLYVVSTNKVGAAEVLLPVAKRFELHYDPIWVFNDRDGSGAIPEGFKPDIFIDNLHPGFVQLVNRVGFTSMILDGLPEYQLSCDHVAAYVWTFANQAGIRSIFGSEAIDSLEALLNRKVPALHPYHIKNPLDDAMFKALAGKAEVARVVMPLLHDVDAAIEALKEFQSAKR